MKDLLRWATHCVACDALIDSEYDPENREYCGECWLAIADAQRPGKKHLNRQSRAYKEERDA